MSITAVGELEKYWKYRPDWNGYEECGEVEWEQERNNWKQEKWWQGYKRYLECDLEFEQLCNDSMTTIINCLDHKNSSLKT